MKQEPLVSVIIPAYNNAEYLEDAIDSVLRQTYRNFELIVVNDASPDNAKDVIKSYDDARIVYVEHKVNKGLSAARNTGIRKSTGNYIALLDGDDYYHLEKLKTHVEFFEKHPDIDVTYNPRLELNHSSTTIRELWRPPLTVGLAELILGYPFSPSDMIVKRDRFFQVNLFDESYTYYGEDMDINCKLALAGCKFASVDRVLNFRRYHSKRKINNLRSYQEDEFRPLYNAFTDPRFPASLSDLKNIALSNRFLGWAIFAFLQEDTALGQEYCSEAVRLNPSLLEGRPPVLLQELIRYSVLDDNRDHDEIINSVLKQLSTELDWLKDANEWAIVRGYLLRGIRAIIWDRLEDGKRHFDYAISKRVKIDKPLLTQITFDLINYEKEYGLNATFKIVRNLAPFLNKIENTAGIHWSEGFYLLNRAYKSYDEKKYANIPLSILRAISFQPSYLMDRGVMKFFVNSLFAALKQASGISAT